LVATSNTRSFTSSKLGGAGFTEDLLRREEVELSASGSDCFACLATSVAANASIFFRKVCSSSGFMSKV